MSQNAGTLNPTRGNRRFILLAIVLGLMGAGLVYIATARNSSTNPVSTASVQPVPVVVAKANIPARTAITQEMVDVKLVPPDAVSPLAFTSVRSAVGQYTRYPMTAGQQILSSQVVNTRTGRSLSYVIPEGKRAFAITASDVQNAGGLVLPGDYVDILLLQDMNVGGNTDAAYVAQTLMQNVEVLAVAQTIENVAETPAKTSTTGSTGAATGATGSSGPTASGSTQRVRISEAAPQPAAKTITLAVTPQEAEKLFLAESNGRIRLTVRPFGDDKQEDVNFQLKTELIPNGLPNR